ncbi:MAG TPA: GNAT family N-acetyltransferase [Candidatus Saccharimonadales bacterium]|nr:GNAT family N-acetyltransferase [Candidatus Saccharimonadales bacterium]
MKKKVRDLKGKELDAWQRDYPRREALREVIEQRLKEASNLNALDAIISSALADEAEPVFGSEILSEEYERAHIAERDNDGANLGANVHVVNLDEIATPEQIEDWGNAFRIHPMIRESYLEQIREGQRRMMLATDEDGEPAGRISLIVNGPRVTKIDANEESPEFEGKPSEVDVVETLGGSLPWIEDLAVMEGYRRSGIGQRLMKEVEQEILRDKKLPDIVALAVRPDNAKAISMYEKLGYNRRLINGHETFVAHIQAMPSHEVLLMVKGLKKKEK